VQNLDFTPMGNLTKEWFSHKVDQYDRYRVSRIQTTASAGSNTTADNRPRIHIFARYDAAYHEIPATLTGANKLLFSNNAIHKTLGPMGIVRLVSGAPKLKRTSGSSANNPLLPSGLQWYNTSDLQNTNLQNRWNLGNILIVGPKGLHPTVDDEDVKITLMHTIDVEFKARRARNFTSAIETFLNIDDSVQYDLELTEDELKQGLLTGSLFPIDVKGINIVNIGTTVTGDDLLAIQVRRQSDMVVFEVAFTADSKCFFTIV
jgi:hypothetical protein